MKILCYVAPWSQEQFEVIARAMDETGDLLLISGFAGLDRTGLVHAYYDNVRGGRAGVPEPDDREIILRCRLLRTLDDRTARLHLGAMRLAVRAVFDRERPAAFLCGSTDQFLHDVLFREAGARGIPAYGLIRSFVNGYFRVSQRGEFVAVRTPTAGEVRDVLDRLLADDYIPQNLPALKRRPRLTYLRIQSSMLARVVYFEAARWVRGEPYNYHLWASTRAFRRYNAHWRPRLSLGDPGWRDVARRSGKPIIYVPLQHYPEATIDYWADDVAMVDYPSALHTLLRALGGDFHFIVKEHPGVFGYRKPEFYRDLEALESVTVVPTNVRSQACIDAADAVLVWTGSVGFEAALRGKPVLTTCEPYYASGERFLKVGFDVTPVVVSRFMARCTTDAVTRGEQEAMVAHLLAGGFPGYFQNDGTFRPGNPAHVAAARDVGRQLAVLHGTRATGA